MKKYLILSIVVCITIITSAQTNSNIKCRIWKPQSFCNIPDSLTGIWGIYCRQCSWNPINCSEIDKMGNMTGVWLTIPINNGRRFMLKNEFKNISLIKKIDGKKIHPYAILDFFNYEKNGNPNEQKYIISIKAKRFFVKLKNDKKFDLILIFPNAEKGDKIIIDKYLETEIQE